MTDLLPLFPLPNVVLFPGVFLPLHIFEPRYRQMVAGALAADHLIGMVLLRDGWEADYEGRPPVFGVGCTAVITHSEILPDGRYNIMLRGSERFRLLHENHDRPYRRASIEPLVEQELSVADRLQLKTERARLDALLAHSTETHIDPRTAASMPDEDLVNALAQYLDLPPIEKQALLERPSMLDRARALQELLEMHALLAKTPEALSRTH